MDQLEVEGISKLYRRGQLNSGSFKQDMANWWKTTVLRQENPFFRIADQEGEGAYFWALKDISFSVPEGGMFAIVGRNGSGKSTLLKIICRITSPNEGKVRGRGRISSMLEVGTGFSPELTGRQNIYLSGHILGMSRREIKDKFDEIVDFSGVDAFIDTPVKRYSSGMYVRLAFSVAAHLQSEIMIIDEVLAVGDADFQEKCMAKMNALTREEGRTVLLVTHNMQPVKRLCQQALWLDKGRIKSVGDPSMIVRQYMGSLGYGEQSQSFADPSEAPGNEWVKMKSAEVSHSGSESGFTAGEAINISFDYWCNTKEMVEVVMGIYNDDGICLCEVPSGPEEASPEMEFKCTIPPGFLMGGGYVIQFNVYRSGGRFALAEFPYALYFEYKNVLDFQPEQRKNQGLVQPPFKAKLSRYKVNA